MLVTVPAPDGTAQLSVPFPAASVRAAPADPKSVGHVYVLALAALPAWMVVRFAEAELASFSPPVTDETVPKVSKLVPVIGPVIATVLVPIRIPLDEFGLIWKLVFELVAS